MAREAGREAKAKSHSTKGAAGKDSAARKPRARQTQAAAAASKAPATKAKKKGFTFKALPADAYTGKQDRLKESLIQKAKLKKQYAKVLKDEGYLGDKSVVKPKAKEVAAKEGQEEAQEQGEEEAIQAPWLAKAVVDDWSADEDEEEVPSAIKQVKGLKHAKEKKMQTADEKTPAAAASASEASDREETIREVTGPAKTGKVPKVKSDKRTGYQPYDASKRRSKFTSAEKEARQVRQRRDEEVAQLESKVVDLTERKRQRALATKREQTMTRRGQPRMGDRIKNLLSKLQGQI